MGGLTPIPFSAILNFAEFYGYSQEEAEELVRIIRAMDSAHQSFMAREADASAR